MPRINDLVKNYNDVLSNLHHKKMTSVEFEIRFDIYKKHLTAQAFQRTLT